MTLIERLRLGGPNALEVTDEAADTLEAQVREIKMLRAENERLKAVRKKESFMDLDKLGPGERSAYSNGYGDCRKKFEERPEFNNWMGTPLGEMSRGALIDALAWCVIELRDRIE